MLRDWYRYAAHEHVQGASQFGKSKYVEWCARCHAVNGDGMCVFDWHGTLYRNILNFLTYRWVRRPIVLMDFSPASTHVVPFNPFALPEGKDPSAHVIEMASLLVKPWGAINLNDMPRYERTVKMMLAFMAYTGEPLHHAAQLLDFPRKELREYAIDAIKNNYFKNQWAVLQYVKTLDKWEQKVESTQGRLGRFLSSQTIVRTLGVPAKSINIPDLIRQKAIVLVNFHGLDPESGKVIAALLLSEFLNAARGNMGKPTPYYVYLDECQNYLTHDAAVILDETQKSGLRASLIHHHMGQIMDPHLRQSMEMNTRINVMFEGMSMPDKKAHAEEFFLDESNERWLKETRYRYVTEHREEPYSTFSDSSTSSSNEGFVGENESGSSGESSSYSQTSGTRYVPYLRKERDGQEDWSREEKIAKLAARFSLPQGQCYVKTPKGAFKYIVPRVKEHLLNPARALEYKQSLLQPFIPINEADKALHEAEARFLQRGKDYESRGKSRPTKKRPLSGQS